MSASADGRDPLEVLAEAFLARVRAGEPLSAKAFADAHPEAAGLQDVLEAMLALETVKQEKASSASNRGRPVLPALERLDDYRIVREVGRGGMGVVFEAVQESLGRRVALKVLPQSHLLTGNQLERFRREAQTAAQLHHTNIVPVFGSGEDQGFHYYAMQFLDGEGLDARIAALRAAPPDPAQRAAEWRAMARRGAEVAAALHYAHGRGTLHRDVKPSNLLLDRQGVAWVTDFGLAKALENAALTHSGDVLGTLQYMAPEQLQGEYDVRSEVYALGVTLHEMLAWQPAFTGRHRSEVIERIRQGRGQPLREAAPGLPRDLETVVRTAMALRPADRYPTAQALADDLQRWLQGEPIRARRHSSPELLWRWCVRNKALALLAASTLLAVVGAAVVGWSAYVVTEAARADAESSADAAFAQGLRYQEIVRLMSQGFERVTDAVLGSDPYHMFEVDVDEDLGAGSADGNRLEIVARSAVSPKDAAVLQQLLALYENLVRENVGSSTLLAQTARAWRRMGELHVRLGDDQQAAQAFTTALGLYQDLHDRDVSRRVAALHNELGNVGLRQGRPAEAVLSFRRALQSLGNLAADSDAAGRFEAARAHYLLAAALLLRQPPGGPAGGPPGRELQRQQAQEQTRLAGQMVGQLVHEDPSNPEYLLLHARCLAIGGAAGDRQRLTEAAAILEGLCLRFPASDVFHFELVEILVGPPGTGRPARSAGERPADAWLDRDEELERLQTAVQHADVLRAMAPDNRSYQACQAHAHMRHGVELALAGRRAEAKVELQGALAVGVAAAAAYQGGVDWRTTAAVIQGEVWLARLLDEDGAAAAAAQSLDRAYAAMQQAVQRSGTTRLRALGNLFEYWEPLARRLRPEQLPELQRRLPPPRPLDRPR